MTKQPEVGVEEKGWSPLSALIWLAAVVLLYVLSVGPVAFMVDRKWISGGAAETFYAPLVWTYENTPLRKPLDWYLSLWERSSK